MNVQTQIKDYIASLPEAKHIDMDVIYKSVLKMYPDVKLWYLDGKDEYGKAVTNPNIGFGSLTLKYADGKTREFYQVGMSANSGGISVYIMGVADKKYLNNTYGKKIGKATVTSYCIKFKSLKDIDTKILKEAIRFGFSNSK